MIAVLPIWGNLPVADPGVSANPKLVHELHLISIHPPWVMHAMF